MPKIEGRNLTRPRMGEMFHGDQLILRVDDKAHPDFWLTLSFTPGEFADTFGRWCAWMVAIGRGVEVGNMFERMAAALADLRRN